MLADNEAYSKEQPSALSQGAALFLGLAAAASTMTTPPAFGEARLPPIDRGKIPILYCHITAYTACLSLPLRFCIITVLIPNI